MPPVFSCTPVSVKGDATYCISDRVCSGAGSNLPGTSCPKKGDVAIAHCWNTLKSYNSAGDNCIAPEDAQCVVIETGVWGCAFPSSTAVAAAAPIAPLVLPMAEIARSEVAADADVATPMALEVASVQPPTVRVDSATTHGIVAANYASANYAFATTLETEQPSTSSTAGTAGVNVLVAVGALVVAVVGVAIAKKRQHDRLDTQNNSIRNVGCVELSTPI